MSSEESEGFNDVGFKEALEKLSTTVVLSEIQEFARKIVGTNISVTHSKLNGLEHKLVFMIHPEGTKISGDKVSDLFIALCRVLSYSDIHVIEAGGFSQSMFEGRFARPVSIFPENVKVVREFLRDYGRYLNGELIEGSKEDLKKDSFVTSKEKSPEQKSASFGLSQKVSAEPTQKRHRSRSSSGDSGSSLADSSSPDTISPPGKKQ